MPLPMPTYRIEPYFNDSWKNEAFNAASKNRTEIDASEYGAIPRILVLWELGGY